MVTTACYVKKPEKASRRKKNTWYGFIAYVTRSFILRDRRMRPAKITATHFTKPQKYVNTIKRSVSAPTKSVNIYRLHHKSTMIYSQLMYVKLFLQHIFDREKIKSLAELLFRPLFSYRAAPSTNLTVAIKLSRNMYFYFRFRSFIDQNQNQSKPKQTIPNHTKPYLYPSNEKVTISNQIPFPIGEKFSPHEKPRTGLKSQ